MFDEDAAWIGACALVGYSCTQCPLTSFIAAKLVDASAREIPSASSFFIPEFLLRPLHRRLLGKSRDRGSSRAAGKLRGIMGAPPGSVKESLSPQTVFVRQKRTPRRRRGERAGRVIGYRTQPPFRFDHSYW